MKMHQLPIYGMSSKVLFFDRFGYGPSKTLHLSHDFVGRNCPMFAPIEICPTAPIEY
jgi:hypothetical protein